MNLQSYHAMNRRCTKQLGYNMKRRGDRSVTAKSGQGSKEVSGGVSAVGESSG
jgi:hypothetical protein